MGGWGERALNRVGRLMSTSILICHRRPESPLNYGPGPARGFAPPSDAISDAAAHENIVREKWKRQKSIFNTGDSN